MRSFILRTFFLCFVDRTQTAQIFFHALPLAERFTVHGNTINPELNDVNRLPIQLIEAGLNLLIFLLIFYLFKKSKMTDKLIFVYMLVYPVVRFTLEFFRGDAIRGFLFGLSTSQWISILLFVTAIIGLSVSHFRKKPATE